MYNNMITTQIGAPSSSMEFVFLWCTDNEAVYDLG